MRNAKVQRIIIMIRPRALQQPRGPHVSHAETVGILQTRDYEGQRCALLTTKSRNTCTRATVFNSSG
jgi:hypothetical protein